MSLLDATRGGQTPKDRRYTVMLLSLKTLFWTRYEGYLWNLLIAALVALAAYAAVRMRFVPPASLRALRIQGVQERSPCSQSCCCRWVFG